jgi:hypothetical protein
LLVFAIVLRFRKWCRETAMKKSREPKEPQDIAEAFRELKRLRARVKKAEAIAARDRRKSNGHRTGDRHGKPPPIEPK